MSKKVWSVHNEHKYFWYHYNYDNYNDRDTMLAIIDLQISEILSLLDIDGDQQWQQQQQPKRSHFGYGSTQPRLMVIAYQPPSWNEEIFEEYGHVKEAIKEYIPNTPHKGFCRGP